MAIERSTETKKIGVDLKFLPSNLSFCCFLFASRQRKKGVDMWERSRSIYLLHSIARIMAEQR